MVVSGIALQWVGGRVGLAVQDVRLRVRGPGAAIDQAGLGEEEANVRLFPELAREKKTQPIP